MTEHMNKDGWIYRDASRLFPMDVETSTKVIEVELRSGHREREVANKFLWDDTSVSSIYRFRFIEEEKTKLPEKFWLVWCPTADVAFPTKRHTIASSAKIRAEELALINPGKEFVVMQSIAQVKASSVVWEKHFNDEDQFDDSMPF